MAQPATIIPAQYLEEEVSADATPDLDMLLMDLPGAILYCKELAVHHKLLRSVCTNLRQSITIHSLSINMHTYHLPSLLKCLSNPFNSSVTKLFIYACDIDIKVVEYVFNWTQLQFLALPCCKVVSQTRDADEVEIDHRINAAVSLLPTMQHLQYLNLSDCDQLLDAAHSWLPRLGCLHYLDVSGTHGIDPTTMQHIADIPSLTYLDLSRCGRINAAVMQHITQLSHLQVLRLSGCTALDATAMLHLSRLPLLQEVDISGCHSLGSAAAVAPLLLVPSLRCLNIQHLPCEVLGHVTSSLTHLRRLHLLTKDAYYTDPSRFYYNLSRMTALTHLLIDRYRGSLEVVHNLPTLKDLNALQASYRAEAVSVLTALTRLVLHSNSISFINSIPVLNCLSHLDLSETQNVKGQELQHITQMTQLRHLSLENSTTLQEPICLNYLSCLTALTYLNLRNTSVLFIPRWPPEAQRWLCRLSSLRSLRFLSLDGWQNIDLCIVGLITSLQFLSMANCTVRSYASLGFLPMTRLTRLQHLDISECKDISPAAFKAVSTLPLLHTLKMTGLPELDGMEHLANCSSIRYLNMGNCRTLDSVDLSHVSSLTNLEYLDLLGCSCLTNDAIYHLSGLTVLKQLTLSMIEGINGSCTQHLSQLTCITHLNLNWIKTCPDMLRPLVKYEALQMLSIRSTDVDGTALEPITHLTALKMLSLGACPNVGLRAMSYVCKLRHLRHLQIFNCAEINGAALGFVTALTDLRHLDLRSCKALTAPDMLCLKGLTRLNELWLWGSGLSEGENRNRLSADAQQVLDEVSLMHAVSLDAMATNDFEAAAVQCMWDQVQNLQWRVGDGPNERNVLLGQVGDLLHCQVHLNSYKGMVEFRQEGLKGLHVQSIT